MGPSEAEDLSQEVFLRVNRSLSTFRGQSKLSTWIYRIATNVALDRLRQSSRQKEAPDPSAICWAQPEDGNTYAEPCSVADSKPSLDTLLLRKEMIDCVRTFVVKLPPNYQTVIDLDIFEEFSNAEIAEILGVSLHTVKIRLHRARAQLQKELAAYCKPEEWL